MSVDNNSKNLSAITSSNPLYEGNAVEEKSQSAASKLGQSALKKMEGAGQSIQGHAIQVKNMGAKVGSAVGKFFSQSIPGFAKGFISRTEINSEKKRDGYVAKLENLIGKHKGDKGFEKTANNAIEKLMTMSHEELNDDKVIQGLLKNSVYKGEGLSETAALSVVRKISDASRTEQPSHLRKLTESVKTTFGEVDFKPMTRLDRIKQAIVLKGKAAGEAISNIFSKVSAEKAQVSRGPDQQGFNKATSEIASPPKDHFKSSEYKNAIQGFLGKIKGSLGFKESLNEVNYGGAGIQKGFTVEIDPAKTYTIGASKVSGKKLKELQAETKVSIDTSRGANPEQVASILKNGSKNLADRLVAGAKIVSSTEILMMGADDKPLKANDDSPTFKAYTVSAPNVKYDPQMIDHFSSDGKLNVPKWKAEIKGILKHMLTMMKGDGVKNAVIPALGLGAFMTDESRGVAAKAFTEALNEVVEENNLVFDSIHLTGDQFNNIGEDLQFRAIENGVSFAGDKDSFAILEAGLANGMLMGVAVAGDPSGQAGQMVAAAVLTDSPPGHIAQEEAFAVKVPTFMLNQNYGANPEVANTANYQSV